MTSDDKPSTNKPNNNVSLITTINGESNIKNNKETKNNKNNDGDYESVIAVVESEELIVLSGPDDVLIFNSTDGLYHQSVTLTARMWPPVEASGPPSTIWGLPVIVWGIIIGCLIVAILILTTLFFCFWILPRKRKFLSPTRYCSSTSPVAHRSSFIAKSWGDSGGQIIMPISIGLAPPQYSAPPAPPPVSRPPSSQSHHHPHPHHHHHHHHHHPPPHHLQYNGINNTNNNNNNNQQLTSLLHQYPPSSPAYRGGDDGGGGCGVTISPGESKYSIPETHKSMWAINPLHASNSVLNENDVTYKSRSLPSWGKAKQRPISTTDDLEELYAKVNFSKKRRNRMRNDEAAIIALCRSRSQNLPGLPLEREGVVIYDERTAL